MKRNGGGELEFIFQDEPKFTSAKEFAYHELRKSICNLDIAPGEWIVEEELVKALGVSRTPLREALSILQHENLVVRQPNKRLKVASISIKEAEEIFQVRAHLEGIAVREATIHASKGDLENLGMIVHAIRQMAKEHQVEKILAYGEKFHFYIYEISGNTTIKNILLQLHSHIRRYRNLVLVKKKKPAGNEKEEHGLIYESMKNGDKDQAEQLMKKHITVSLQIAIKAIEEYGKTEQTDKT
jgi:DNA-binding GntR family transcriptional regulator